MQFRDLQQQYQILKTDIDNAVIGIMSAGTFIRGQKVEELESRLASYVGVSHCVSCANGTDALYLALRVWGIGPGDAVFVPDFTFFSSAEVVSMVGATPIFVDVDETTFNISPSDLERKVSSTLAHTQLRPRVVIAVDLFGLPANFTAIRCVTSRHGMFLLEDGAQGFGGCIGNRKACSFGDIAITSFFPSKPLGCYGDGGAFFTNNAMWAALAMSYCQHGKGADKYNNVRIGFNSRLDAIQAAVLLVKLKAFADSELSNVNCVANSYTKQMEDFVECPIIPNRYKSSWAQYTIRLANEKQRNALQQYLASSGVPTHIYYPTPLHMLPVYSPDTENYVSLTNINSINDCPVSCRLSKTVLSLPMHPYLSSTDIETIVDACRNFFLSPQLFS